MANFIIGVMFAIFGFIVILKAYQIQHQLIPFNWFEQKFGSGTGTSAYRFIGLGLLILGLLVMFGVVDIASSAFEQDTSSTPQVQDTPQVPTTNIR